MLHSALFVLSVALAGVPARSQAPATRTDGIVWDARAVEHLFNRAAFGARTSEIEAALAAGPEALVDRLLEERSDAEPPYIERIDAPKPRELREMSDEAQQKAKRDARERDRRQILESMGWSFARMSSGEDPLLERMTLFWHGFFTTSIEEVKRSYEVLRQDQWLRENALGSYSKLLAGIVRDPAMLVYLDNNVNKKGAPNENLARELMELFSLGQGNYTEDDIKEGARALTGYHTADGEFVFRKKLHDDGEKTILGKKGKHDGDAFVRILLEHPACPRFVARRLLTHFEGVEPDSKRLDAYAAFLKQNDYEIKPFLRRLFLDPAFYRDEIVGARVQGPIEYLVGAAHRLGIEAPPAILGAGAALLGQRLFAPPSVKGWDEGEAWITTSTLMQRGNLTGLMLGVVKLDDILSQADLDMPADESEPMQARDGETTKPQMDSKKGGAKALPKVGKAGGFAYQALKRAESAGWSPAVNFTNRMRKAGATSDAQIVERMCDDLLAIPVPESTKARMREFLSNERASSNVRDGELLESGPDGERVLRRLAHLVLSLPEAQLG